MTLPRQILVMLAAAVPVTELRGAIPWGIFSLKLNPMQAAFWATLGNLLPVYPILVLLGPVTEWSSERVPFLKKLLDAIYSRARAKHSDNIERYGAVALAVFVAIPAPGTGAWTGALLAFLFAVPWRLAVPAIAVGVVVAAVLVTSATVGALKIFDTIGNPLVSAALFAGFLLIVFLLMKRNGASD